MPDALIAATALEHGATARSHLRIQVLRPTFGLARDGSVGGAHVAGSQAAVLVQITAVVVRESLG